jgi:hypothetical protein
MLRFDFRAGLMILLAVSGTAGAHHSNAPHYDASRPVQIEGVVSEFEFVNPHAFVHVDVAGDSGTVGWDCELAAAIMLTRRGWSADTLVPGQPITVNGIAARRDPHGCSIRSIVLEDGTELTPRGVTAAVGERDDGESAVPADTNLAGVAGVWVRDSVRRPNGPLTGPGPADREPPGPEHFTAEGAVAQTGYDERFDDPSFRCSASSIARAWSGPGTPTEIRLDGDRLTIRHEFMDTVRVARFGVREHAEPLTPVDFGHSIAWLEGDTLVIDTIGYSAGVLFPHPGVLHSDALHTVERLSVDPDRTLRVAWVAEDPRYFTSSFSGEFLYQPSRYQVQPYGCTVDNANR